MKANKQVTVLTEQLIGELHLDSWDDLVRRATPSGDYPDTIRRHVDAIRSALAKAGRLHYLPLSIFLLIAAAVLLVSGVFFPALTILLIVMSMACFAIGLFALFLVNPQTTVLHVESFIRNSTESLKKWDSDVNRTVRGIWDGCSTSLNGFVSRSLANQSPITDILSAISSVDEQARSLNSRGRERLDRLNQDIQKLERRADDSMGKLRVAKSSSSAPIVPTNVRRAANAVLGDREQIAILKRERIVIEVVLEHLLARIVESARTIITDSERDIVGPLNVLQQQATRTIQEYNSMNGRDLYGKMLPSDKTIATETAKLVDGMKGQLFGMASRHTADGDIGSALHENLERALENSTAVPQNIAACIRGLNGGFQSFLAQFEAEATEMAISKAIPGREQRRFRTVINQGGSNSEVFRAIEARSEGCVTRDIDYEREDEVIVVTEERFQPGSELIDLVEASKVLKSMSRAKQAAMVVAVDDDDLVLDQINPERRTDALRGLRQLCLGLVFGGITRSGNSYKLSKGLLSRNSELIDSASLGQGLDNAASVLQTDERIGRAVDTWLKSELASRGSDETGELIRQAIDNPGLVPALHAERVRQVLAEEINRTALAVR